MIYKNVKISLFLIPVRVPDLALISSGPADLIKDKLRRGGSAVKSTCHRKIGISFRIQIFPGDHCPGIRCHDLCLEGDCLAGRSLDFPVSGTCLPAGRIYVQLVQVNLKISAAAVPIPVLDYAAIPCLLCHRSCHKAVRRAVHLDIIIGYSFLCYGLPEPFIGETRAVIRLDDRLQGNGFPGLRIDLRGIIFSSVSFRINEKMVFRLEVESGVGRYVLSRSGCHTAVVFMRILYLQNAVRFPCDRLAPVLRILFLRGIPGISDLPGRSRLCDRFECDLLTGCIAYARVSRLAVSSIGAPVSEKGLLRRGSDLGLDRDHKINGSGLAEGIGQSAADPLAVLIIVLAFSIVIITISGPHFFSVSILPGVKDIVFILLALIDGTH